MSYLFLFFQKLQLPKEVFASQNEEEIGMLNKAAPHKGPLLNWDPDIVETLDDEFQHGEQNVYKLKDLEKLMEAGEDEICNSSDEENALDMILAKAQGENELSDIGKKLVTKTSCTWHSGPENLKKSRPKKLVKSNKSISRKNFLAKFHFLQLQKWPKIIF